VVRFNFSGNGMKEKLKIPHMGWNQIVSRKEGNPVLKNVPPNANLDKGLIAAEELIRETNSTKNIIVLSDGIISPEGFDGIKKTVNKM